MCTAAAYKTKDFYFGRTLDYEFSYGDEIAVTPRNLSLIHIYRTDAFTIRTWYDSCYNSSRTYIIQHTVLRMWNHLHCTFSISNDLPAS